MQAVFDVALPVFALILSGYAAGRLRLLGPASSEALNLFVYWFALPALLFMAMFKAPSAALLDRTFLFYFLVPTIPVLAILLAGNRLWQRLPPGDVTAQAVTAVYGNVGYMGVPLVAMLYGPAGVPSAIAAMILSGAVMFGIGVAAMELSAQASKGVVGAVWGAGKVLVRNPTLMAPLAGALLAGFGLPLPTMLRNYGDLMAQAASPCALFALGLFLNGQSLAGDRAPITWLVILKLGILPGATAVLIALSDAWDAMPAQIALLLNCLPTGAGAFVLARLYDRQVAPTSGAILVSTVLSILPVAGLVALFAR